MAYRPYPNAARARNQVERSQQRPRVWKVGDAVGPRDFGISPAAPNLLADAMKRDLSGWAETVDEYRLTTR